MRGNFITDRSNSKNPNYIDGRKGTRLYSIYRNMLSRCYNKNTPAYKYYGGRNIGVSIDWRNDFKNFKKWALENNYNDGLTLDRINNEYDYVPTNCRWVPMKIQNNNKRSTHFVTINDVTLSLDEWCELFDMNYHTVQDRLRRGWNTIDALTKRPDIRFRKRCD